MEDINKVRKDLKAIRCYYLHQKLFDESCRMVGGNDVVKTVEKYNAIMRKAPPILYVLYVGLYVQNVSQEAFAQEYSYSPVYIQRQNVKLLQYLQEKIKQ